PFCGCLKPSEGGAALTNDDVIHRSRLRLFALAREMGSVRAACRLLGVHHSTYYRWRRQLLRFGPELLRPRERRQPRMPNAISPMVEQRILALALAYPGWGPDRLSLELAREKWGGDRCRSCRTELGDRGAWSRCG